MKAKATEKKDKIKIVIETSFITAGKILQAIIRIADEELVAQKGGENEQR